MWQPHQTVYNDMTQLQKANALSFGHSRLHRYLISIVQTLGHFNIKISMWEIHYWKQHDLMNVMSPQQNFLYKAVTPHLYIEIGLPLSTSNSPGIRFMDQQLTDGNGYVLRLFDNPLAHPWLSLKTGGNAQWSHEPTMHCNIRQSWPIFTPTNHKIMMPANWRPCLIPHWQSYCHHVMTV